MSETKTHIPTPDNLNGAFAEDVASLEKIVAQGSKVFQFRNPTIVKSRSGDELEIYALCSSKGDIDTLENKHVIVYAISRNGIVGRRGVFMRFNGSYFSANGAYIETALDLRGRGIAGSIEAFHGATMQSLSNLSGKQIAEEVENANADRLEEALRNPDRYSSGQIAKLELEQKAWRGLFNREKGYMGNTKVYEPNSNAVNKTDFKELSMQDLRGLKANLNGAFLLRDKIVDIFFD